MGKSLPDLGHLARPGSRLTLRVTPRASRNAIDAEGAVLRIYVTTVPEGGKANAAVLKLLAKALGVPKSRLRIVQGETGRDKVVEIG